MTIYFNNSTSKIKEVNFNNNKMKKVYFNGTLVFSATEDVWSSTEVYLTTSNYVGIRIYDASGNPMAGDNTTFTITYTLYRNSVSSSNSIKSDTATAKPSSSSGNITFSTGVAAEYGVYYCAVVNIAETDKYSEWDGITESEIVRPYTRVALPSISASNVTYGATISNVVSSTSNVNLYLGTASSQGSAVSASSVPSAGSWYIWASLSEGFIWSDTGGTESRQVGSFTVNKATITSSDIVITMGESGGCVRAKVDCGFSGLTYTGKFRRKSDDALGALKTGTTGSWVQSTWETADDKYGFRVYSIEGNSNINGWTGDKGAGSWY